MRPRDMKKREASLGPRSFAAGQIRQDYGESRRQAKSLDERDQLNPSCRWDREPETPTSIGPDG
jgi:hypothetical protein